MDNHADELAKQVDALFPQQKVYCLDCRWLDGEACRHPASLVAEETYLGVRWAYQRAAHRNRTNDCHDWERAGWLKREMRDPMSGMMLVLAAYLVAYLIWRVVH